MKSLAGMTVTLVLLAMPSSSGAEYIIYLKGGHYIVADDCTFWSRDQIEDEEDDEPTLVPVEDCTKGKPEGPIFWSTLDGKFGEVSADNVYAIIGSRTPVVQRPAPAKTPLEDYLIINRDESFVNVKVYEEKEKHVVGFKSDTLARVDRRTLADISREGEARTRSGEGLCPGETPEFSVNETSLENGNLVGVITNLATGPWTPGVIEVEVREQGRLRGKFSLLELNVLGPGESVSFDEQVRAHLLKYVQKVEDPDAGVRLCYRKRKTGRQTAVQPQR
jgi:hypothetical protein